MFYAYAHSNAYYVLNNRRDIVLGITYMHIRINNQNDIKFIVSESNTTYMFKCILNNQVISVSHGKKRRIVSRILYIYRYIPWGIDKLL